ncbi:uncharacterized protein LOC126322522 [Schistocerca gregaria]|uniref:uncharacterized protein LOC126322522 n=1 Tax=Schistocerca gregaria TaxID=7010 RepID=UPI00211EC59E|nr:uncharacterized protein LOC126322522 [Schistocerca gregaria]
MKGGHIVGILAIILISSTFVVTNEGGFINDFRELLKNTRYSSLIPSDKDYCSLTDNITCNDEKEIIGIHFKNIDLSGKSLPQSISNLQKLQTLSLINCKIRIDVYPILNNLKTIEITSNQYFKNFYINSPNLVKLDLSRNALKCKLSDLQFSKTVKYLNLSGNQLYDTIDIFSTIGDDGKHYEDLEVLDLSKNTLTGDIKESFNKNFKLSILNLGYNLLSGEIPSFEMHTQLKYLDLSHNSFSGTIPKFTKNINLVKLELGSNQLTGTIPFLFTNTKLSVIDFSSNKLRGGIPNVCRPSIVVFNVSSNNLVEELPDFCGSELLSILDVSNNMLVGSIPTFPSRFISKLYLGNNLFKGRMPSFSYNPYLEYVNFSHNSLSGRLYEFDTEKPLLTTLDLSSNKFSKAIPSFYNARNIIYLNLSNNHFSHCSGIAGEVSFVNKFQYLDLSNNHLESTPNFDLLASLKYLNLSFNKLTGQVPSFSQNYILEVLDISKNSYTGGLSVTGDKLRIFNISSNKFKGYMPLITGAEESLKVYDISNNKIRGKIEGFESYREIQKINLSSNMLSGSLPTFKENSNLELLLMSENQGFTYTCTADRPFSTFVTSKKLAKENCKLDTIKFSGCNNDEIKVIDSICKLIITSNARSIYYIGIIQALVTLVGLLLVY